MAAHQGSRRPARGMPSASVARIWETTVRSRGACNNTVPGSARPAGRCLKVTACEAAGWSALVCMGVPVAPAHIGEAAEIGPERTSHLLLIGRDALFGLSDLARQLVDGLLRFAELVLAAGETGHLKGPQRGTVLLELHPVPGDLAVGVGHRNLLIRSRRYHDGFKARIGVRLAVSGARCWATMWRVWQGIGRHSRCRMISAVIARESGRSSIPETPVPNQEAAAYWIPRFRGV